MGYEEGKKDGPAGVSTCCSYREPIFSSHHPHGNSQPSITPMSGYLFSDLPGHLVCR